LLSLFNSHFILSIWALCAGLATGSAIAAPGDLDRNFANQGTYEWTLGTGASGVQSIASANGWTYAFSDCQIGTTRRICVERWQSPTLRDATFGDNGVAVVPLVRSQYGKLEVHAAANGIVLVTSCDDATGTSYVCLARFAGDSGALDTSFGVTGISRYVEALSGTFAGSGSALTSDGAVVVNVQCFNCALGNVRKWNAGGELDAGFANDKLLGGALIGLSTAHYLQLGLCQPLTPSGYTSQLCIGRFALATGVLDRTYGIDGLVYLAVYQSSALGETRAAKAMDGSVFFASGYAGELRLVKVAPSGVLLTSFGNDGVATGNTFGLVVDVNSVAIDSAQRPVVFSTCWNILPPSTSFMKWCIHRWTPDGLRDYDFGLAGSSRAFAPRDRVDPDYLLGGTMMLDPADRPQLFGGCLRSALSTQWNACMARLRSGPYDASACALNSDANNGVQAGSDGQLIVRYLLGLRGAALTNSAVGSNPGRTNAEIETYLADLLAQGKLDADGDGQSLAMTDGLLILRAMLGLTGDALTAGAVNTAHPNARNAQQILSWIESTHGVACLP